MEEPRSTQRNVLDLLSARKGHFLLESGHHGDLWLDLELLYQQPRRVQPFCAELAARLSAFKLDAVCSPLVEGAFVGLMVAIEMALEFAYSERFSQPSQDGLFPAGYRIPTALRAALRGKRVAIVNDVINAGSAVRGTYADLQQCGAVVVAIGTLLVLGPSAGRFASSENFELETLAAMPNNLWAPAECHLCASALPLEDPSGFGQALSRPA